MLSSGNKGLLESKSRNTLELEPSAKASPQFQGWVGGLKEWKGPNLASCSLRWPDESRMSRRVGLAQKFAFCFGRIKNVSDNLASKIYKGDGRQWGRGAERGPWGTDQEPCVFGLSSPACDCTRVSASGTRAALLGPAPAIPGRPAGVSTCVHRSSLK